MRRIYINARAAPKDPEGASARSHAIAKEEFKKLREDQERKAFLEFEEAQLKDIAGDNGIMLRIQEELNKKLIDDVLDDRVSLGTSACCLSDPCAFKVKRESVPSWVQRDDAWLRSGKVKEAFKARCASMGLMVVELTVPFIKVYYDTEGW